MEAITLSIISSLISSPDTLTLFRRIANQRIVDKSASNGAGTADQLRALKEANLIYGNASDNRYFVTATGLQVARDLEKLPMPAGF
jgi:hypothetical protein